LKWSVNHWDTNLLRRLKSTWKVLNWKREQKQIGWTVFTLKTAII